MSQLADALEAVKIKISKFEPSKARPITSNVGTVSVEKFCRTLKDKLSPLARSYPDVFEATHDIIAMGDLIEEYAKEQEFFVEQKVIQIPKLMRNLKLNYNLKAKGREDKFFMSTEKEIISEVSGDAYLLAHQLGEEEGFAMARKVIPDYMPRGPKGVVRAERKGLHVDVFNTYEPPGWKGHKEWNKLEDDLPVLFKKLVRHLFPIQEERKFFYSWLRGSLYERAFTYLVLCSNPGTGKNRLKLVMRALHGHVNSVDGKRSTLVERFNSQLAEATLAWFDELRYDSDMENVMKEIQNDSISIERKGIDATKATKIHASCVISNNKPRDNFIAFDTRKFAPLVMTADRLEASMTPAEITELTNKVEDETRPTFDKKFLAQIAKWVKKHASKSKWPNYEFKGPMFWSLAHTSMTRWQKKVVTLLLEGGQTGWDEKKKMFRWSEIEKKSQRKHGEKSLQFPDYSSVKAFLEIFRDSKGQKAFVTELIPGENVMADFWVKPLLKEMKIVTEASIAEEREKRRKEQDNGKRKEKYDV